MREIWHLLRQLAYTLWVRVKLPPPECPVCGEPLRLTVFPETKAKVLVCDECYKEPLEKFLENEVASPASREALAWRRFE